MLNIFVENESYRFAIPVNYQHSYKNKILSHDIILTIKVLKLAISTYKTINKLFCYVFSRVKMYALYWYFENLKMYFNEL